jgi:hypothetical protein
VPGVSNTDFFKKTHIGSQDVVTLRIDDFFDHGIATMVCGG